MRRAKRNRIDPHGGEIERLGTKYGVTGVKRSSGLNVAGRGAGDVNATLALSSSTRAESANDVGYLVM